MLNLNAAKRRHVLRMRKLDRIDKIKEVGRIESTISIPNSVAAPKQDRRLGTKYLKITVFLLVYELVFPILFFYDFFRSFTKLNEWLYEEDIAPDTNIHEFISVCWFTWQVVKTTILYPIYFVYSVILDCREIQAETSWGKLAKRLFV